MENPVLTTVTTYVRTYMREVQLSTVKFGLKSVLQIHPKQVPRCKKKKDMYLTVVPVTVYV